METFDRMARELTPYVDRCIFSFVEMYKKLEVNMPELRPVSDQDKLTIAEGMGAIARKYGLHDGEIFSNALGHLQPGDKVVPSRQESLLSKEPGLFD